MMPHIKSSPSLGAAILRKTRYRHFRQTRNASLSRTGCYPRPSANNMAPSKRILEPSERIAEVLFGLIMVLTFTGSLSIAEADRAEVRSMLIGALGCNTVWGL